MDSLCAGPFCSVEAEVKEASLTLTADPLPARRLYGIFFDAKMAGSKDEAELESFAKLLELTEADTETRRAILAVGRCSKSHFWSFKCLRFT